MMVYGYAGWDDNPCNLPRQIYTVLQDENQEQIPGDSQPYQLLPGESLKTIIYFHFK